MLNWTKTGNGYEAAGTFGRVYGILREGRTFRLSCGEGSPSNGQVGTLKSLKLLSAYVEESSQRFHEEPAGGFTPIPQKFEPTQGQASQAIPSQTTDCPLFPELEAAKAPAVPTIDVSAPTTPVADACSQPVTTQPIASPSSESGAGRRLTDILRNAAPKVSKHPPTEEQVVIMTAAKALQGTGVLVIEAGAGAGKTTTLTMLEKTLPGRGQYTAFNSSLVNESKSKFTTCQCNTTHSLAFRAVGKEYAHRLGGARVRSDAVAKMLGIEDLIIQLSVPAKATEDGKTTEATTTPRCLFAGYLASQVLGAIRRFCQSADREISDGHFKYIDGIDFPVDGQRRYDNNNKVREYLLPFAHKAWADLSKTDGMLPFTHDCYVKLWQLDKPIIACDYLLLDEQQDTAEVMLDVIRQNIEAGVMAIMVGDSAQQIYEWRGAVNAMKSFPEAPRCYLSQSFRFGPAIAQLANQVLEQLEEKTALRLRGFDKIDSKIKTITEPKAILTRTNSAAVSHLLQQVSLGKRPFLVGGGSDVVAFVEGAQSLQHGKGTSHPDLACFANWQEVQAYSKDEDGEDLRLMVKIIDDFGAEVILSALRNMPKEADADIVISTAHKSKGREWDSVKLAADFPTLSKCGDSDLKLLYVALTRAKLVLDISECPFFTGKDALPFVLDLPKEAPSLLPPAPAMPATQSAEFTWAKCQQTGAWAVRGPSGKSGETVSVTRKDGSTSKKKLGKVSWDKDGIALYLV